MREAGSLILPAVDDVGFGAEAGAQLQGGEAEQCVETAGDIGGARVVGAECSVGDGVADGTQAGPCRRTPGPGTRVVQVADQLPQDVGLIGSATPRCSFSSTAWDRTSFQAKWCSATCEASLVDLRRVDAGRDRGLVRDRHQGLNLVPARDLEVVLELLGWRVVPPGLDLDQTRPHLLPRLTRISPSGMTFLPSRSNSTSMNVSISPAWAPDDFVIERPYSLTALITASSADVARRSCS